MSPVMLMSLAGGFGLLAGVVGLVRWRLRHAADPLILRLIAEAGAKAVPGMGRPDWQIIARRGELAWRHAVRARRRGMRQVRPPVVRRFVKSI